MTDQNIKWLAGTKDLNLSTVCPLPIFPALACDFLSELSKELRSDREAAAYPDVISFAFWCRRGNIQRLKKKYEDGRLRLGKGLVFHIAPSNVPVNFAFSFVFGLLSGNGNIVRVPSKNFPQSEIICRALRKCFDAYKVLEKQNVLVSYDKASTATEEYSRKCSMRVIWGGDDTIRSVRSSPIGVRAGEITFADRYSIAVLDGTFIEEMEDTALDKLALGFYNDTYLMDQNACSSPQMIFWKNGGQGKRRFWEAINKAAKAYDLEPIKVSDKYTELCSVLMKLDEHALVRQWDNYLYVVTLKSLPESIDHLRGKFGMFYEYDIRGYEDLLPVLDQKVQTITYAGIDPETIGKAIAGGGVYGVDRIVPVGKAMDIGPVWDGYDFIYSLSREIICE